MKRRPADLPKNRIRVMVVMSQPIVRGGIVTLLQESGRAEVISAADHQSSWVDLARRLRPDVVVVDIEFAGLELAAMLAKEFPKTAVIALSAYDTNSIREQAEECGVKRFISRSAPLEEVVDAVLCPHDKCTGWSGGRECRCGPPGCYI